MNNRSYDYTYTYLLKLPEEDRKKLIGMWQRYNDSRDIFKVSINTFIRLIINYYYNNNKDL